MAQQRRGGFKRRKKVDYIKRARVMALMPFVNED